MLKKTILLSLLAISAAVWVVVQLGMGYDWLLHHLYDPAITTIQPRELHQKMSENQPFLLLDIRSSAEFRVSHLQGATFVEFENFDLDQVKVATTHEIVLYCSVGYRSERVAEKLLEAGFTNVKNVYGGIFQWKNEGFPVVKNHHTPTNEVHAYNKFWGMWLRNADKVYD